MKKILIFIAIIILLSLGIPLIFVLKQGVYVPPESAEGEKQINVYIKKEDKVVTMPEKQYLKEVVSAEMPATFEREALKAQAVAARSYLYSRLSAYEISGKPQEHKGADICTDSTHCNAWIDEESRKTSWGISADKKWKKISDAVEETDGEVMTFDGEVISAVFFSTSSGRTENAEDVWGSKRAYLVSVDSPNEEEAPNFTSQCKMSKSEFCKILTDNIEGVNLSKPLVGDIVRSDAGGIKMINLAGVDIKGTVFRKIFGLKSTNASVKIDGEKVIIDVVGYGHGVGMSQYGADAMAKNGADYKSILTHYYTGVKIENR